MGRHSLMRRFKPKRALAAFFIILATAAIAGNIYIKGLGSRLNPTPQNQEKPIGAEPFNVLVIGKDADSFKEVGRADTIMLVRVFPKKKKAYLVSIPRDTRAKIDGHGFRKINSAYAYGDIKLASESIENLLDIEIARYVVVNWTGFEKMVDLFGGVWIDVEKKMDFEAPSTKAYIHLKQGRQLLSGKEALGYVRFRHDRAGDLGRIPRQQKFIYSLIDQAKQIKNILKLPKLIDQLVDNTRTNTSVGELLWLGRLFWDIDKKDLSTDILPGQGKTINGASYFIVDQGKVGEVEAKLGAKYLSDSGLKNISINVYNASGITGIAKTQAKTLEGKGFKILNVRSSTRKLSETIVFCRETDLLKAKAVAVRLPNAIIKISSYYLGDADVAVMVGKDIARTVSLSSQRPLN